MTRHISIVFSPFLLSLILKISTHRCFLKISTLYKGDVGFSLLFYNLNRTFLLRDKYILFLSFPPSCLSFSYFNTFPTIPRGKVLSDGTLMLKILLQSYFSVCSTSSKANDFKRSDHKERGRRQLSKAVSNNREGLFSTSFPISKYRLPSKLGILYEGSPCSERTRKTRPKALLFPLALEPTPQKHCPIYTMKS